jgi:argininosuccinate synthase
VNGTVTLALYKGNIDIAGRKSESSLYRPDIASFTMGASYNQKDAEGFIRILGLPARSRAIIQAKQNGVLSFAKKQAEFGAAEPASKEAAQ